MHLSYNRIYEYDMRYTEDSSTEFTQGTDESEIVRVAIDCLLEQFNSKRLLLNKLKEEGNKI